MNWGILSALHYKKGHILQVQPDLGILVETEILCNTSRFHSYIIVVIYGYQILSYYL